MEAFDQKKIKELITEGKIKEALESIASECEKRKLSKYHNRVLALFSELRILKDTHVKGLTSDEDYRIGLNRVNYAALETVDELAAKLELDSGEARTKKVKNWQLWLGGLGVSILILFKVFNGFQGRNDTDSRQQDNMPIVSDTAAQSEVSSTKEKKVVDTVKQHTKPPSVSAKDKAKVNPVPLTTLNGNIGLPVKGILVEVRLVDDGNKVYSDKSDLKGSVAFQLPASTLAKNEYLELTYYENGQFIYQGNVLHKNNPTLFRLPAKILLLMEKESE
ncbi:MAG: hypothetical protein HRU41_36245 [Saprospiraceae bacterium]|nr:hypothetical protein [Saprospiraceae bacterium]